MHDVVAGRHLRTHAAGQQLHRVAFADEGGDVARAVLLTWRKVGHVGDAHGDRRHAMLVRERAGHAFAEGLAGAIHVRRARRHVLVHLRVQRIALDGLRAAGKHHSFHSLRLRRAEDVVRADDVRLQQLRIEIGAGVRHAGQVQHDIGIHAGGQAGGVVAHVELHGRAGRFGQLACVQVGQAQGEFPVPALPESGADDAGGARDEDAQRLLNHVFLVLSV